mmetsp:Transcript_11699/g.16622  ORF Transcript_11699/g.16622 Transcript_11699/m.16622 type:complete len:396 (-) Transcript_11699:75-1262(-)
MCVACTRLLPWALFFMLLQHQTLSIKAFLTSIPISYSLTNIPSNVVEAKIPKTYVLHNSIKKRPTPGNNRGTGYGKAFNSTIPSPEEAALSLGVRPTSVASQRRWKVAWAIHKRLLPLLHLFDSCNLPNSSLNIACMWWKALSGNDRKSPVYDNGLSYDVLPSTTRLIVGRFFRKFYPRLHHANVEMRTAFLDNSITRVIEKVKKLDDSKKVRLITFGAGYDLRSVKFLERELIEEAVELDLAEVVEGKGRLLGTGKLLKRRPWLRKVKMPKLVSSNLNDIDSVKDILGNIIEEKSNNNENDVIIKWHNIFVFEAVMIYLDKGVPCSLLQTLSTIIHDKNLVDASLCFADRLENIPGGDLNAAEVELARNGWQLRTWKPKPGLARHMGDAVFLSR